MITYSELILINNNIIQNVDILLNLSDHRAGIELMMDGKAWDAYKGDFSSLIKKLNESGARYSVHPSAWDCNLTAQREVLRTAAYELNKEAIDFSEKIGASYVVIHPGFLGSPAFNKKEACERAYEQMANLAAYAEKRGVKLAMENVGYHGQSIYPEEEFATHLDNLPDNTFYLIDTGHAFLNDWDIPTLIEKTKDRLLGLHLHDNHGSQDEHLVIGQGKINWGPIFDVIKRIYNQGFNPELVLEFRPGTDLEQLESCYNMITETYGIPG